MVLFVNSASDPKKGRITIFTNEVPLLNRSGVGDNFNIMLEPGKQMPSEIRSEMRPMLQEVTDSGFIAAIFVYREYFEVELEANGPVYTGMLHLVLASIIGRRLSIDLDCDIIFCYLPRGLKALAVRGLLTSVCPRARVA